MEKKNYKILVVDDEIEYQRVFSYILKKNGYTVQTCSSALQALEILAHTEFNLVMTDLKMPDMDGVELVKQVKASYEDIDIMVITAFGSIESAVEAMKYGACGYSIKNSEPETLLADIDRLAKLKLLEDENKILAEQNGVDSDMFLTSESPRFQQVLETCRQIAASDINVLILGESGVGKEIIARDNECSLLRKTENKTIERVGSNKPIDLDIRLISATNKDIEAEIKQGVFREDLLYRINTITITIPPLRQRKEDLPGLIEYFIRQIEKEQKKKILEIDPLTLEFLYQYDYPGNVRELKNLLERMVALSEDGILRSRSFSRSPIPSDTGISAAKSAPVLPLRAARGIFEKEHIENALQATGGNVAAAAELLEITKRQLWNKIAEYKIQR